MLIESENIEHTHIVYSVDSAHKLTLTKIGVALINKEGDYVFDINKDYSKGDILLYRKSDSTGV